MPPQIFSPTEIAQVCHEANRVYQLITHDPNPSLSWNETSQETQDSAIEGVTKALVGATPEELHESWCEFKENAGWVWGTEKSEEKKTHPCLVDYDQLPIEQRIKDSLFQHIVYALSNVDS